MRLAALISFACALSAGAFEVTTRVEQIPESNPVTRYRISDGHTHFSFIAPFGWTTSSDVNARRIALQANNAPRGSISIQISTNAISTAAQLRHEATNQAQNATVMEEFKAPSGGSTGFGIDVRYVVDGRPLMMRTCVFKTPEGCIEIKLAGMPEAWAALHPFWTGFMNSFRVETEVKAFNESPK